MFKNACLVLSLVALSSPAALANNEFTLGAGVGVATHPYKDYDAKTSPIPVISYSNDNVWLLGPAAGIWLWNTPTSRLSIMTYWSPLSFTPKDSDDYQLRQLDKRHSTMMTGMSYILNSQYGTLRTSLATDILNESNGSTVDIAWLYSFKSGSFSITPGAGVVWNDRKQNQYYYGISEHESGHSGLNEYSLGSSWNPYIEISVDYNFYGSWNIFSTARYTHLPNEITDSPMVEKSGMALFSAGITYTF